MLEDIALSISTLFFVLCNIIISSFAPAVSADKNSPSVPLETTEIRNTVDYNTVEVNAAEVNAVDYNSTDVIDEFAIVGVWESFGYTYEFTSSGNLIVENETLRYTIDGNTVTVSGKDADIRTMKLEPLSSRAMRLNGITMYKIN